MPRVCDRSELQAHVANMTPLCALSAVAALALGALPVGLGLYGPATALALSTMAVIAAVRLLGTPSKPA